MRRSVLLAALAAASIAGPAAPSAAAAGHAETLAPVYAAAQGWLNGRISPALTGGKVVVVDVFTFDCYNCQNVVPNLRAQGISWPVAIDNSFAIWNAYGVDAWPTQLFFDRSGTLRATIVGDSQDDAVDRIVRKLLAER
jgi:hypothetical protein